MDTSPQICPISLLQMLFFHLQAIDDINAANHQPGVQPPWRHVQTSWHSDAGATWTRRERCAVAAGVRQLHVLFSRLAGRATLLLPWLYTVHRGHQLSCQTNWCKLMMINMMMTHCDNDNDNIDRLVQERHDFRASAMELRLSCTNPSIWWSWSWPWSYFSFSISHQCFWAAGLNSIEIRIFLFNKCLLLLFIATVSIM